MKGEGDVFRWKRPKAARRAVPVATEKATGIDSRDNVPFPPHFIVVIPA